MEAFNLIERFRYQVFIIQWILCLLQGLRYYPVRLLCIRIITNNAIVLKLWNYLCVVQNENNAIPSGQVLDSVRFKHIFSRKKIYNETWDILDNENSSTEDSNSIVFQLLKLILKLCAKTMRLNNGLNHKKSALLVTISVPVPILVQHTRGPNNVLHILLR